MIIMACDLPQHECFQFSCEGIETRPRLSLYIQDKRFSIIPQNLMMGITTAQSRIVRSMMAAGSEAKATRVANL